MSTISTDIRVNNVKTVKAWLVPTAGRPVRLELESHLGTPSYITLYIGDEGLASRLVDAINGAAAPPLDDSDAEFAAAVKASIEYYNRYARDDRR